MKMMMMMILQIQATRYKMIQDTRYHTNNTILLLYILLSAINPSPPIIVPTSRTVKEHTTQIATGIITQHLGLGQ